MYYIWAIFACACILHIEKLGADDSCWVCIVTSYIIIYYLNNCILLPCFPLGSTYLSLKSACIGLEPMKEAVDTFPSVLVAKFMDQQCLVLVNMSHIYIYTYMYLYTYNIIDTYILGYVCIYIYRYITSTSCNSNTCRL